LKLLREPLVHFCVLGVLLFAASSIYRRHVDAHRIVVSPERTAQLANRYALQFGAPPDAATLASLIEQDTHEEMLFRQGLALHLDRDDEIVRRRVVEKMRFLLQDRAAPAEPSDAQLEQFYTAHSARYAAPERVTFTHVYFSGDETARSRAQAALAELKQGRVSPRELGDAFPDLYDFAGYEPDQVVRLFGRTPFADAVLTVTLGEWSGPYHSSYGWHLVRVDARQPARQASFAEVRERVRTDYLAHAQDEANTAAFAKLARDFTVEHPAKQSVR
jgi:parvulin-like peptidyl-prolyl isomerase